MRDPVENCKKTIEYGGFGLSAPLRTIQRDSLASGKLQMLRSRIRCSRVRTLAWSLLLAVALAFFSEPSLCADAGPLTISVPPGFEGPTREDDNGGVTVAWIERQPASGSGTLLQVSAIDVGSSLDGITPAQRLEGATHYLLEFVRGVGQSLLSFQFGEFEHVSLAGLPAARVRWTATTSSGHPSIGVIYCVLVGHSVVSLQTRDTGTEITPAMYSAMSAIEGVHVR
jgi:hypothetical protein